MATDILNSRILLVDDAQENRDLLKALLSGYQCTAAKDGVQALEKVFSENKPDLILLDINMPGMDGYEVIQKLKSDDTTKDIPVIFLTGNTEIEDETKGLTLGAIDYIAKPINPKIIRARVKNHLELKFARAKLEQQNVELTKAIQLKEDVDNITRHDLKSPLSVIFMNTQMLLEFGDLNQIDKRKVKLIEKSGYHILEMINRTLDLYKIERGIYNLKMEKVNVLDLLNKIKEETASVTDKKGINTKIILDGKSESEKESFVIKGETFLFYSLLSNLFKNALEASPQNTQITVTISATESNIQIKIHNKGAVPEEIKGKFFDKYVSHGKQKGTGLGTYSAKLMAEAMNGSISMQSSEDAGTMITLKFPKFSV